MKENTNKIIIGSGNNGIKISIPSPLKHCQPYDCFFVKEIKEMTKRNSEGNNGTTNITQNPQKGDIL